MTMLRLLPILLMLPAMASADCSMLECPLDAPCVEGNADFSDHLINLDENHHGMHCSCPYGWTGIKCNVKYESCDASHKCYNGGECVEGLFDKFGNSQLFCDCSKAVMSDGTKYVGKYCETPFTETCDSEDETFCVNGGDCNPNYPSLESNPCICADGYEGYHCEFKKGTVPSCDLDCQNDGLCVVGVISPAEAEQLNHVWTASEIESHQRCICKQDYGGLLCQASAEDCGGDTCYHGGSCIETSLTKADGKSVKEYHCDCTTAADGDNLYAGKYCQYESSTFCSDMDENLFCTNGGSCKSDPTEGCDCPTGYHGFKCEFADSNYDGNDARECGDVYCFNGGKCITTELVLQDGTTESQQTCDCSETFDGNHYYAGRSCQYKSTEICSDGLFCVHGGTCPTNTPEGCDCPDGWKGDMCEIHIYALEDEYPQDPTCGANVCLNGGTCYTTQVIKSDSEVETQYKCDCSTALDTKNGIHYAGDSCQFPSTGDCTKEDDWTKRLFCANHGSCQDGDPRQGCHCEAGFTGFSCEFEDLKQDTTQVVDTTDYETCGDDLVCHNGGKCITSLVYDSDGTQQEIQHCDCATSATETTAFAGDSCQYEQTTICTAPLEGLGLESAIFCVNQGECNTNDVRQGCVCPTGWSGFRCEYPASPQDLVNDDDNVVPEPATCGDLVCKNGGKCEAITMTDQNTQQVTTIYQCDCLPAANGSDGTLFFAGDECQYRSTNDCSPGNNQGMFCVNGGTCKANPVDGCDCPAGWTGKMCDVLVKDDSHAAQGEECGTGYCYNGGKCITTKITTTTTNSGDDQTTITEYHCSCESAFDENHQYGGESCEHQATSYCSRTNQGDSLEGWAVYCANGGTCRENPSQGCDCPPEWTGVSCEFQTPNTQTTALPPQDVEECGDLICLNGGKCITSTISDSQGNTKSLQHCDCSEAYDTVQKIIFAGKQCEYQQTEFCSEPGPGEELNVANYCTNGGECQENILSGCDCPLGFTGFRCEYESDDSELVDKADDPTLKEEYVACGDQYCYNGGSCISHDGDYKCDCTSASTGSMLYAGRFCQYEMTSLCTKGTLDSLQGADFCVNNGVCPDGEDNAGCTCPSGYTGFRCDEPLYAHDDNEDNIAPNLPPNDDDNDDNTFVCHLQCQNDGTCAKGAKDDSHLGGQFDHVNHLNKTFDAAYFEHCVCKQGWFGLECEHKAAVCGADEHLCLHGSKCVKMNQEYECNCDEATSTLDGDNEHSLFAGDSCEHPATDICVYGDIYPGRPLFFCTNQGKCKDYVSQDSPDPGCTCPPEWTGPHCELRKDALPVTKEKSDDSDLLYIIGSFLLMAGIVAFGFLFASQRNSHDQSSTCMPFRRRRRGAAYIGDESNNLAPKRISNYTDDMPASRSFSFRSGSDPMTSFELPPDNEPYRDEPQQQQQSYQDEPDDEPEQEVLLVNVGPQRDEDGNALHNVDFL